MSQNKKKKIKLSQNKRRNNKRLKQKNKRQRGGAFPLSLEESNKLEHLEHQVEELRDALNVAHSAKDAARLAEKAAQEAASLAEQAARTAQAEQAQAQTEQARAAAEEEAARAARTAQAAQAEQAHAAAETNRTQLKVKIAELNEQLVRDIARKEVVASEARKMRKMIRQLNLKNEQANVKMNEMETDNSKLTKHLEQTNKTLESKMEEVKTKEIDMSSLLGKYTKLKRAFHTPSPQDGVSLGEEMEHSLEDDIKQLINEARLTIKCKK